MNWVKGIFSIVGILFIVIACLRSFEKWRIAMDQACHHSRGQKAFVLVLIIVIVAVSVTVMTIWRGTGIVFFVAGMIAIAYLALGLYTYKGNVYQKQAIWGLMRTPWIVVAASLVAINMRNPSRLMACVGIVILGFLAINFVEGRLEKTAEGGA